MRFRLVLLVLFVASCGGESPTLTIVLTTDLVPGVEVFSATVSRNGTSDTALETPLRFGDPVDSEFVIGDVVVEEGTSRLVVAVRDAAGLQVAARLVRVTVTGDDRVVVVITRDCAGVSCPGAAGDPGLDACLGGMCASADCVTGEEDVCPPAECTTGADCPAAGDCASATCLRGLCLYRADHATCASDEYCSPLEGCRDNPFSSSDGGMDGGDAGDGGMDGGDASDGGEMDGGDAADGATDGAVDSARPDTGPPACDDGVWNGDEADVDCGGPCPACAEGRMCRGGPDCASGFCSGGTCMACSAGAMCSDPVVPCRRSRLSCSPGPMCEPAEPRTAGIPCGGTGICNTDGLCDVPNFGARLSPGTTPGTPNFGRSMDMRGGRMVVGAFTENSDGTASGAAYVYERSGSTWTFRTRLQPVPIFTNARFGLSVDIDGDLVAVGAPHTNGDWVQQGVVHVFERQVSGAYTHLRRVAQAMSVAENFGELGSGVAVTGSSIIAGARGEDMLPSGTVGNAGSAYLITDPGSGYAVDTEITRASATTGDIFGQDVDADGDYLVIGAHMNRSGGLSGGMRAAPGYAIVYERSGGTWTETALLSGAGVVEDEFGLDVELRGTRVIVGAPYGGPMMGGGRIGAAYVYDRGPTGWTLTQELLSPDPEGDARFGGSVCTTGSHIIVGAPLRTNASASTAGAAYVFEEGSDGVWRSVARLSSPSPMANDQFGTGCGADVDTVAVSAVGDDAAFTNGGAVYLYDLSGL